MWQLDARTLWECDATVPSEQTAEFVFRFEIKKTYNEITADYPEKSIKFTWIPFHIGIEYNEAVDSLANTYTNSSMLKPSIIPFRDHHQEFKKYSFFLNTPIHDKSGQF